MFKERHERQTVANHGINSIVELRTKRFSMKIALPKRPAPARRPRDSRPVFVGLQIENFKSFSSAKIAFGQRTAIIGSNASGKSNLRDAIKFLHAIARGYSLAEAFAERVEFGARTWDGIRGGSPEAARWGTGGFTLTLDFAFGIPGDTPSWNAHYRINVDMSSSSPRVKEESLYRGGQMLFDSDPKGEANIAQSSQTVLPVYFGAGGIYRKGHKVHLPSHIPVVSQAADAIKGRDDETAQSIGHVTSVLRGLLGNIRFLDFDTRQMRQPAPPGQRTISENGHNLSSVLQTIQENAPSASNFATWLNALTPMDVSKLEFEPYPDGRVFARVVEKDGRKLSLASISDGTLRFLGILAALFSPDPPSLICFEEIETGFHPARLHLVADLLSQRTSEGVLQVLLTTHSPVLLRLLQKPSGTSSYLAYRVEGVPETRLRAFESIPNAPEVLKKGDPARLMETGWFEETMFFAEGKPETVKLDEEEQGAKP